LGGLDMVFSFDWLKGGETGWTSVSYNYKTTSRVFSGEGTGIFQLNVVHGWCGVRDLGVSEPLKG